MKNISIEVKYKGRTIVAGSLWNLIISQCLRPTSLLKPVAQYEFEDLYLEVTIPAHHLKGVPHGCGDIMVIENFPESGSDDH